MPCGGEMPPHTLRGAGGSGGRPRHQLACSWQGEGSALLLDTSPALTHQQAAGTCCSVLPGRVCCCCCWVRQAVVTAGSQCVVCGCQLHVLPALQIVLGKEFEADHVYLPTDGDAVYEDEVVGLVGSLYEGINSTVFAYGESASLCSSTNSQPHREQLPGVCQHAPSCKRGWHALQLASVLLPHAWSAAVEHRPCLDHPLLQARRARARPTLCWAPSRTRGWLTASQTRCLVNATTSAPALCRCLSRSCTA